MRRVVRGLVLALLVSVIAFLLAIPAAGQDGALGRLQEDVRRIARIAGPAVVSVRAERTVAMDFPLDPTAELGPALAPGIRSTEATVGTGILVSDQGHVLTTCRMVAGSDLVTVTLANGREAQARVLGGDPFFQVSVLQLGADAVRGVSPLELGEGPAPEPGTLGVFLGCAFGRRATLSLSVVSATGMSMQEPDPEAYDNFLVQSAPVRPGEAGGPLVGTDGRVLGMGVGTFAGGAVEFDGPGGLAVRGLPGSSGVGLLTPAADLRYALGEILAHGRVRDGRLGVRMDLFDLTVRHVTAGTPAQAAGLAAGDVIHALDGRSVESFPQFRFLIRRMPVGKEFEIRVRRGDGIVSGRLSLEERPPNLRGLLGRLRESSGGLVLVSVTTLQARAGLREGDLLLSINDEPVPDLPRLVRVVFGPDGTDTVRLKLRRGEEDVEVDLER